MKVKIRLFASIKDLAGFSERDVDLLDAATTEDVWRHLVGMRSGLGAWRKSIRFAVNTEYVTGPVPLKDGDEVSVIPPVSGG